MYTARCICCSRAASLGSNFTKGQTITCPDCGTLLEIISLNPPELDWAYLEQAVDEETGEWAEDYDWDSDREQTASQPYS